MIDAIGERFASLKILDQEHPAVLVEAPAYPNGDDEAEEQIGGIVCARQRVNQEG